MSPEPCKFLVGFMSLVSFPLPAIWYLVVSFFNIKFVWKYLGLLLFSSLDDDQFNDTSSQDEARSRYYFYFFYPMSYLLQTTVSFGSSVIPSMPSSEDSFLSAAFDSLAFLIC